MTLLRTLRVLVALEIALTLVSIAVDAYFERDLPGPLREIIADQDRNAFNLTNLFLGFPLLLLLLAGWTGLWRLKPWARSVYSIASLIGFVTTPFYGPFVSHGVAHAFSELGVTAGGM